MDDSNGARPRERGIEPVLEADAEIKAAIDEAVQAVEKVERRREQGSEAGEGEDAAGTDVAVLQEELTALRDRSLRTLADFDNYRKRVERERAEVEKYAPVDVLRELLGIVDNLERAISAEGSLDDLKQGVDMILKQVEDFLRKSGVVRVAAVGETFDPSVHEAVSRVEDPGVEDPTVVDEFQAGYVLHQRLLRPSIVRVAVPADAAEPEEQSDSAGELEASDLEETPS